jgi:hypothetical protein
MLVDTDLGLQWQIGFLFEGGGKGWELVPQSDSTFNLEVWSPAASVLEL